MSGTLYLKRTWHSRSRVAHVDESDNGQADEEPAQEAHEVQQVVEVSNEQEQHGEGVLKKKHIVVYG